MIKYSNCGEAIQNIKSGDVVIIGSFSFRIGPPLNLLKSLLEHKVTDLTIIILAISNQEDLIAQMVKKGMVKKLIIGFNNSNKDIDKYRNEGLLEVEYIPYGTLIEKVRAGGAGIGGFYTKVGADTILEQGKEVRYFNNEKMILEEAINADVGLINAWKSDPKGNLVYWGYLEHLNHLAATCAKHTIAEVEEVVNTLEPNQIRTPSIFVDEIIIKEIVD